MESVVQVGRRLSEFLDRFKDECLARVKGVQIEPKLEVLLGRLQADEMFKDALKSGEAFWICFDEEKAPVGTVPLTYKVKDLKVERSQENPSQITYLKLNFNVEAGIFGSDSKIELGFSEEGKLISGKLHRWGYSTFGPTGGEQYTEEEKGFVKAINSDLRLSCKILAAHYNREVGPMQVRV
ncbi:MAG: hypothetical protein GYA55_14140 [SAR324 cluster bacterium]|uniref:Uncharacterized protein n=1 Tax=SAR324 cluster bacterium TaxID=2024889 RepID=A0A7X9IL17_9DELT|nr:hypothetical protein [SAR324 cluster bacterium]